MGTPLSFIRAQRRRISTTVAVLCIGLGAFNLAAEPTGHGRVAEAIVEGAIDPGSGEFIKNAIKRAESHDYEALVIRLNTPGGLVSTTREIVASIFDSSIPVIVYVGPPGSRAGSAGVFITLAGHVAAMAPATNIGAAHPINVGGGDRKEPEEKHDALKPTGGEKPKEGLEEWRKSDDDILKKKIENDLSAFMQSIAEERGRNTEWAVAAVRESESISASRALELKVIDYIASDRDDLLAKADGRTVKLGPTKVDHVIHTKGLPVDELPWGLKHLLLHAIGDPNIASILMMLGGLGILIEFYHPGAIVPGVMGAILLLLGVIGVSALPVNAGAVALLLLGIGLFAAELFVTSHGLLGVAGAICFAAGGILLVDPTGDNFFADKDFGVSPAVVLPTSIFCAFVAMYVGYNAVRAWRLKPVVGASGMIGEVGEVNSDIAPGREGMLLVHGELWRAISDRTLAKGARAQVVELTGLVVRVEPSEA
jgi:membrane-bound serine protease (ClpP class)